MAAFQGSGFVVELPDGTSDASSYAFVLPDGEGYAPNLTVRFEAVGADCDLPAVARSRIAQLGERLEAFELLHEESGSRGPLQGVLSTVEWGAGEARVRQRWLLLLSLAPAPRLYTLTATDLAARAGRSDAAFDAMLRSFVPNDRQFL